MGKIRGICISQKRGTQKTQVEEAVIVKDWGIEGDAHGGPWHRQISLLSLEKIEAFRERGAQVEFGAFGENIIVEGIDPASEPVGTRYQIGGVVLEQTQIGKACHSHCAIYHQVGDCIMPREGTFARVISGGPIRVGDEIEVIPPAEDRPFTVAVITLSDKGAKGEREDLSGPAIVEMLPEERYRVEETILLADEPEALKKELTRLADQRQIDLILTTGGTGFSPRDNTPEATTAVCDRMAPGIAEAIRADSMKVTRRAMLSRGVAGIRKKTLIINLPGSPKAVREALSFVLDELPHGLDILRGSAGECAAPEKESDARE